MIIRLISYRELINNSITFVADNAFNDLGTSLTGLLSLLEGPFAVAGLSLICCSNLSGNKLKRMPNMQSARQLGGIFISFNPINELAADFYDSALQFFM
jgi:hypothetical protein